MSTVNENNRFDYNNIDIEDMANRLKSGIVKLGLLAFGASITKDIVYKVGNKFLEDDALPVKTTYADWWPRTCQKVKEFASKFWSRRVEGTTAGAVTSTAMTGLWFYSAVHPAANTLWNLAEKATLSFLNLFGFKDGIGFGNNLVTFSLFPSIVSLTTSLSLGTYDLARKYFDPDRALETKPIFNPELQAELDEILDTTRALKEEKGFLQNLLLYGPPGTGKTMVSKWIATNSNMNYILMSGGDLLKPMNNGSDKKGNQTGAGAAVDMLQKLMEHAKSLSSPTVIFIDEAEACFGKRDDKKSQELISLLNAFLELTGQPTSKVMLILATNRPDSIDSAVLSRMDYKILVGPPELTERKNIIGRNISILFHSPEDQGLFTQGVIDHIAKKTEGFSGRDIFKLINRLKIEVRQKRALNPANIDKVIARFVKQEQQVQSQKSVEDPLRNNPFFSSAKASG